MLWQESFARKTSSAVEPTSRRRMNLRAPVDQVDFPNFAGDLIKNTFNAIVDSSIQQMAAYGKLLSEVATKIGEGCKSNC